MKTKTCFKCHHRKPVTQFYRHPMMADGHLGKCKECTKRDVRKNYAVRKPQYMQYDRERQNRADRKAWTKAAQARHRRLYPQKYRARMMTHNAIRSGRLVPKPCVHCGATSKIEAHHRDYAKPLDVTWVCRKHHREIEHGIRAESA